MDTGTILYWGVGVFVASLVIGIGSLFIFGRIKIKESRSWPTVTGLVTHSSVESEFVRAGSGQELIYAPKVIYEYEVGGTRYTSSQLAIMEFNSGSEELARKKAEKYVPGQRVDVHYDPQNPANAILKLQ